MTKENKSIILLMVILIILSLTQTIYYIGHAIDYHDRIELGNKRWTQVEERIVTVENRLDVIEERVDEIEKGL